jgi:transposase-like protein
MAKESRPWRDGRRSWDELSDWFHTQDGDPLDALGDIGALRGLLDQAELEAVRAARRSGRSWADVAARLGVTRQSVWERWRDRVTEEEPTAWAEAEQEITRRRELPSGTGGSVLDRAARAARRRSWITVPNLLGQTVDHARRVLDGLDLLAVAADPDGPQLTDPSMQYALVTDQSPESGARVGMGAPVRVWVDRGGGSGVREPRRPRPTALQAREIPDEEREQAVG